MTTRDLLQQCSVIFGTYRVGSEVMKQGFSQFSIIDTATGYGNLSDVGAALASLEAKPMIIAKFNPDDLVDFSQSSNQVVKDIGKDPEIVLLRSPVADNVSTLRLFRERFPRALIGVSNFDIARLQILIDNNCKPDVISLECSPYYQPKKLVQFCCDNDIIVTGYRVLVKGEACKDPVILMLAQKYNTSPVSVLLTWSLRHKVIPIYATNNPDHLNVDIIPNLAFDDIMLIDSLDKGEEGLTSVATCMLKHCGHDF